MKFLSDRKRHTGVALVVALLFLLVVTVISLIAASNSTMGLKMSANLADASESFQSAEAGVIAVLAMAKDAATDPFKGEDNDTPFADFDPEDTDHPLSNLNDGAADECTDIYNQLGNRLPEKCHRYQRRCDGLRLLPDRIRARGAQKSAHPGDHGRGEDDYRRWQHLAQRPRPG